MWNIFRIFYKPEFDFLEQARQGIRLDIRMDNFSKPKKRTKMLKKMFGKDNVNLLNPIAVAAGHARDEQSDIADQYSASTYSHGIRLYGKGANIIRKLAKKYGSYAFKHNGIEFRIQKSELDDDVTQIIYNQVLNYVMKYRDLSGAKIKWLPVDCTNCGATLAEDDDDSDDGHDCDDFSDHDAEGDSLGNCSKCASTCTIGYFWCCSNCDHRLAHPSTKELLDVFKDIWRFQKTCDTKFFQF